MRMFGERSGNSVNNYVISFACRIFFHKINIREYPVTNVMVLFWISFEMYYVLNIFPHVLCFEHLYKCIMFWTYFVEHLSKCVICWTSFQMCYEYLSKCVMFWTSFQMCYILYILLNVLYVEHLSKCVLNIFINVLCFEHLSKCIILLNVFMYFFYRTITITTGFTPTTCVWRMVASHMVYFYWTVMHKVP